MFEIVTRNPTISLSSNWEPLPDENEFATEAEAWEAVETLRELFAKQDGHRDAEYDVRPIAE